MQVLTVAFIHCTLGELRSRAAFEEAARFTRWECTVIIRCDDTGEEMQFSCTPPGHAVPGIPCWGWRYFYDQWIRRFGHIS